MCARTCAPPHRTSCCLATFHTWCHLPLGRGNVSACVDCCNGKCETHTYMTMSRKMAGVWQHSQPRTRARMYGDKPEHDTAVVCSSSSSSSSSSSRVVAHHSTAERKSPPGLAVVAQPHLPRVRPRQGWVVMDVERLEGEVILLYGAGGVCEAMKTGLMLAGLRINFNQRAQ